MGAMSDLSVDVREAERDGRKFFATLVRTDPATTERAWAIFDVEAARESESGIAFVKGPHDTIVTGTLRAIGQAVTRLNEGN